MYLKVFENFLDEEKAIEIHNHLLKNDKFVWFYESATLQDAESVVYTKTPFFVHPLLMDGKHSNEFWLADCVFSKLVPLLGDNVSLMSSNVNLLPEHPIKGKEWSGSHVDRMYMPEVYDELNTYTAVYYVNDSPSGTLMHNEHFDPSVGLIDGPFTDKQVIPARKNSLLVFDSRIYHSAPVASEVGYRSVINFNFVMPKESSVL